MSKKDWSKSKTSPFFVLLSLGKFLALAKRKTSIKVVVLAESEAKEKL